METNNKVIVGLGAFLIVIAAVWSGYSYKINSEFAAKAENTEEPKIEPEDMLALLGPSGIRVLQNLGVDSCPELTAAELYDNSKIPASEIRALQKFLVVLDYLDTSEVSGVFDDTTTQALKSYQSNNYDNGMLPTGVLDRRTYGDEDDVNTIKWYCWKALYPKVRAINPNSVKAGETIRITGEELGRRFPIRKVAFYSAVDGDGSASPSIVMRDVPVSADGKSLSVKIPYHRKDWAYWIRLYTYWGKSQDNKPYGSSPLLQVVANQGGTRPTGQTTVQTKTYVLAAPNVSCSASGLRIMWDADPARTRIGTTVDINDDTNWHEKFWHRLFSSANTRSTVAPYSFQPVFGETRSLALVPGETYYVRIFYPATEEHSPVTIFTYNCGN